MPLHRRVDCGGGVGGGGGGGGGGVGGGGGGRPISGGRVSRRQPYWWELKVAEKREEGEANQKRENRKCQTQIHS